MQKSTQQIKEAYAYLRVNNAPAAIDYYKTIFGATEIFRLVEPSGRIGHIELNFGSSVVMLCDEYPEYGILGPQAGGSTGLLIHLHVDNADEMAARAIEAGAVMVREPSDAFYGERSCVIRDPFGHEWMLGHEIEQVSYEEMQRRYTAMFN